MEIIHRYSRAQAIEDGVLVDVTETAKEAGIRFPTALTRAVWCRFVEAPDGVTCQDERGRLWDILWMLRCRIAAAKPNESQMPFQLYVRNNNLPPKKITLKAHCGPGDKAEPVITIMLPEED